jgi:hypothetical protein
MMSNIKINESQCDGCGQPLFLDSEECRKFIESKTRDGFIVCSCCGARGIVEKDE